ncbi:MAG: hypothetical protein PHW96_00635 [Candidatus Nanoarchaeia archaeon]|nr:hypothetical protein [Candidatus Nanoarchaeia archaeon]
MKNDYVKFEKEIKESYFSTKPNSLCAWEYYLLKEYLRNPIDWTEIIKRVEENSKKYEGLRTFSREILEAHMKW